MAWLQLHLATTEAHADAFQSALEDMGACAVTLTDGADQPVFEPPPGARPLWQNTVVSALFDADRDPALILAALQQQGLEAQVHHHETLDDQVWERAWMDDFAPIRFGERLWIVPSWSASPDPQAVNLKLDPGLAFGTGTHETTALCLEWLDRADLTGKAVLDFGCGSGEFLAVCRENGADVTGIEPGKDYANFAREEYGLEILNDSWENIDLGDRKFQVITAFHVFEHLRDPLAAMKWLSSHISDDGVIAIAVPDLSPNPNSRRQLFEDLHFAHVFGFTPPTLELLGRKCGLEPHPDIPIQGTDIVFRKTKVSNPAEADPDYAREISTQYGNSDVVGHIFRGGWIVDAYRRAKKDISDSFRKKK